MQGAGHTASGKYARAAIARIKGAISNQTNPAGGIFLEGELPGQRGLKIGLAKLHLPSLAKKEGAE
jgi:hypothetical protein